MFWPLFLPTTCFRHVVPIFYYKLILYSNQPNWSPNPFLIPITLDGRPHDFLCSIADWIDKHAFGMRIQTDRLACVVIREHKQVFHGIGAYTVIELFFIAGELIIKWGASN